MSKRSIRALSLAERKARPLANCIESSVAIQKRFLRSECFQQAHCLALYSAIHNEVLTDSVFVQALQAGKLVAYPRVRNDCLEFVAVVDLAQLTPGAFGVLEPRGVNLIKASELDLVVVPGVAFDYSGHRLGYGRGFYDRALAGCRGDCTKVGFAYESQLHSSLPSVEHDEKLTVLITENRTLNFTT